ncbi:MAG: FAD-dependent oxidoreductase [Clostridia bacterium]|nr:FAD-dependent oxidoreductase [Clostridia bacterium]
MVEGLVEHLFKIWHFKNKENFANLLVSASHVAFSSVRVMRTLGQLGEVVGMASLICKKHNCTPRQVYTELD